MGHKVAEERVSESNKKFAYLTRESDIKIGRFIVSNLIDQNRVSEAHCRLKFLC